MSEVSSEAVEAAARAAFDADSDSQWTWETLPEYEKPDFRRAARAALTAALPYLSPSVAPSAEEVGDELSGWPIGSGYYATQVGTDEARDMAEAVLALFASQPAVAQVREQVARELEALLPTDDEVADPQPCSAGHDCHEAARYVTVRRAQRIARGETKGGE